MPSKRRNNGRSKKNRGHTGILQCTNCNRIVAKDKCIKKFTVRDIIDASSREDIQSAEVYESFVIPKVYQKLTYCVSCAIHSRIVAVRSREDRRIRNVKKIVTKEPVKETEAEKLE